MFCRVFSNNVDTWCGLRRVDPMKITVSCVGYVRPRSNLRVLVANKDFIIKTIANNSSPDETNAIKLTTHEVLVLATSS